MNVIRLALLSAAALSATPAIAQSTAGGQSEDIVVTARSLEETARALRECLERNCPPAEDIRATLAHAENQFTTGDYRAARQTMLASIRRNNDAGGEAPIELSDLYRANGRVAAHLGDGRSFQSSTLTMRDILRENLPAGDGRILAAEIEVADARGRLGYRNEARDAYMRIARNALAQGQPRIAAFAQIRQAMLDLPGDNAPRVERNSREAREAVASLERIIAGGESSGADMALLAEVLLARYERRGGDLARTEALMRRFAAGAGATRPLLISGEPIRLNDRSRDRDRIEENALSRLQMNDVTDRWLDVGFWIEADGTVGDVEVLRSEGDRSWAAAVERSIRSRRYTPLRRSPDGGAPGFYMIERYTMTALIRTDCTGTRIACRDPEPRIERIDLTPENVGATPTRDGR